MQAVTVDREKYIGGSDIPIIMGISAFKSRFDLLLEKAGIKEDTFEGNQYTEYGNVMEPKIRQYINETLGKKFVEGKHIDGDIRCHTDGIDSTSVLEIKTTSKVYDSVDEYKVYLVQLLFYMFYTGRKSGVLAVYRRPEDFSEEFDMKRLQLFMVNIDNYVELIQQINDAVHLFKIDLAKVKANPFITEQELMPVNITELSNKVLQLENELKVYDNLKKQYDTFKEQLRQAMIDNNVKKWTTPNNTQITLVADSPDKEVEVEYYDEDKFIQEHTELHERYHNTLAMYKETKIEVKKGRKGYVKITPPKEEN